MQEKRLLVLGMSLLILLSALQSIGGHDLDTSVTPTGGSGPDFPPPATGDWIINSDTSVWDETIIVNGSLIVTETGKLTLINCILKINCTSDGQYKIRVNSTGEFYVYDSTITPYDTASKYRFEVYGLLWTNHSTIEYMWGDENSAPYTGGIQIYGVASEVWLNHTLVTRSGANGIHAIGAVGVNITGDSNITGNTRMELYADNSMYINLTDSNFTDYIDARIGYGIWVKNSQYINIYRCHIANHQSDNLRLNNTTYSSVTYCDIGVGAGFDNFGSGIRLDYCNSTLRIAWNNISDNVQGTGISYVTKSSPIIENNNISNNLGGIGNGNIPKAWYCEFYVYNNTIENNFGGAGLYIVRSNGTIINNTFWADNIVMYNSYAWVEDCYIKGGDAFDCNASSPFIVNTTIVAGSNGRSFNIENDSHPFPLNCTVDYWDHAIIEDTSNVTVHNYLHVRVVDLDGVTPIPNAWVNVTDNGVLMFSGQTDTNGEVLWIVVANRTYLQDFWNIGHPFTNISYNETIVQVEKDGYTFADNPRTIGMDTNHWEIFQVDPKFDISLSIGWNLISLPLIQTDESLDKVLESIDGKWDYIMAYNASDTDHWKTNSTYKPDQLNDLKSLNHNIGFWIHITEPDVNLTVKGCLPTSTNIPLYAGWNLVGYPTQTTETVANALWGTGADRVEICDVLEPYQIKEVGPTYIMKPGEGYWIHVPVDSVWVVDW